MVPKTATPQVHFAALPLEVVGPVELGRLIREVNALNDNLTQQSLRQPAVKSGPPRTSRMLRDMAVTNKIDLTNASHRKQLQEFLTVVKGQAPLLHMSFSAEPTPEFVEKLMAWLRKEIHPLVLVTVGLQPSIIAGCVVRGTNRYFDFSLRKNFTENRELLMNSLRELQ